MLVRDLMKTDVRCVGIDASIRDAAVVMRDAKVGFVPVCQQDGRVVGTLTDRDIAVRAVAYGRSIEGSIASIISNDELVCCRPDDDLRTAERRMAEEQVSRILVVDERYHLKGVISLSDVAKHDRGNAVDTLRAIADREARASTH